MERERVKRPGAGLVVGGLALGLAAALLVALSVGAVRIPPALLLDLLLGRDAPDQAAAILLTLRLPRVVGAAAVGAALSTAGVLFQGLLRNPLADPYVVGTSGGAALGAVLGMLLASLLPFTGLWAIPLLAFVGALGAMALVIRLAAVGGRLPVVSVLLAGFALSTLLAYTVSLLLIVNERLQLQLPRVYGWLLGGIAVTGWAQLTVIIPLVLLGLVASFGFARSLNAFTLGEDGAARLGIAVERDKRWIIALGALLTAAAVSISGLVGFVGLIVPHVMRLLCGPDHRLLVPAAALAGALFLVLADLLARTLILPAELPLGIVTAFLGGPFFLWLLRRTQREFQW
jgi:iron complex transport system permease protein